MKSLKRKQPELLSRHSFISILPEALRKEEAGFPWPEESDRWISMYFEDIRPEHLLLLPQVEKELGRSLPRFNESHADQIVSFLERCHSRPEPEVLYANCVAGISRSGAVVSFALESFKLDPLTFRRDNPQIMPNNLVLLLLRQRWELLQKKKEVAIRGISDE